MAKKKPAASVQISDSKVDPNFRTGITAQASVSCGKGDTKSAKQKTVSSGPKSQSSVDLNVQDPITAQASSSRDMGDIKPPKKKPVFSEQKSHSNANPNVQDPITTQASVSSDKGNIESTDKLKRKAPNSRPKRNGETRTSFTYLRLHKKVLDAVSDEIGSVWFNRNGSDRDSNNDYATHVMGSFQCKNSSCPQMGWGSKKVAIQIRGYPRNGYDAVVYNQRCKSCDKLGILRLNEDSYIDRVAYRIKKWAGVRVEVPVYAERGGPPHQSEFCEGCRQGLCQERFD